MKFIKILLTSAGISIDTSDSFKADSKIYMPLKIKLLFAVLMIFFVGQIQSQDLDVPYVPTPNDVLEQMLDLADVQKGDYVIDLGSGDGRIVIAAAKRGAVGHGVDLDPERVAEARENAVSEGVHDRVMFFQGDIFETDFSHASVVTLYLLPTINRELRPSLLENLRPGTRVVSHSFDMGEWQPDESLNYANRDLYFWVIPADLDGMWEWEILGEPVTMMVNQQFQEISAELNQDNASTDIIEATLKGDRLNLILEDEQNSARYIYSGVIEGSSITGTAQIHESGSFQLLDWTANLREE